MLLKNATIFFIIKVILTLNNMAKTFPYSFIRKKICKSSAAVIPIQSKVVQYGCGFFGGIRANWNAKEKQLYIFRLEDHHKRMKNAAKILHMTFDYSYDRFSKLIIKLIKKNKIKGDVYIRPIVYAGSTELVPRFNNPGDDLAIYIIPLKEYFKTNKGLNICVSTWRRFDDDVMSCKAKITGSYVNSALAKTEAIMNGFDEAIFLNRDGNVCEASSANIFAMKGSKIITPPLSANNLDGITRRTIIKILSEEMGIEVLEQEFDRSMLYTFDNIFFTGTAAKISWVGKVDNRVIGNGKIHKKVLKLKEIYDQVMIGELEKYKSWLIAVY